MGDPRRIKKKFETPSHPWQGARIEQELVLKKAHGIRRKHELYRMGSRLKYFKDQAKALVARTDAQAAKERQQLQLVLARLGLIGPDASLDAVLGLTINQIMDRRLQTLVHKKGLARTPKQARQFIVHRHVTVAGRAISAPSFLVPMAAEDTIAFTPASTLSDPGHPERVLPVPTQEIIAAHAKAELPQKKIMTEEELEAAEIARALSEEARSDATPETVEPAAPGPAAPPPAQAKAPRGRGRPKKEAS